jgi:outer membrane protein assembly factor BamB
MVSVELTNRITQISYVDDVGLLVGDVAGRIHLLDDDLRPVRSSPALHDGQPITALIATEGWAVGKDRHGNLSQWELDSLDLIHRVDSYATCVTPDMFCHVDAIAEPILGHGLGACDGQIYTSDRHGQLVQIDLATFTVTNVDRHDNGYGPVTYFCADHPTIHAVVDHPWRILLGSLPTLKFSTIVEVTTGSIHGVRYDVRHNRFWAVQHDADKGVGLANGAVLLSPTGDVEDELFFSRYAIAFLEFSPNGDRVYAGGAEGVLHVIDNVTRRPTILCTVDGFPHQLIALAVPHDGSILVLTVSGELLKLDPELECVQAATSVRRQEVWDLSPVQGDPHRLYCGTDEGVTVLAVQDASAGGPSLIPIAHHRTRFGMVRSVLAVPGGYVAIGYKERVFRVDEEDGKVLWSSPLDDLGYGLAVSTDYTRVLVASGIGGLEFDMERGGLLEFLSGDGVPLTVAAYGPAGERILGNRAGLILTFAPDENRELWWIETGQTPRRMWCTADAIYVCGDDGLLKLHPLNRTITHRWTTRGCGLEAALVLDDHVYTACTDGQLHVFSHDRDEPIAHIGDLPDMPHALALVRAGNGSRYLLAGGSGGYLATYRIAPNGMLRYLRRRTLPRCARGAVGALRHEPAGEVERNRVTDRLR